MRMMSVKLFGGPMSGQLLDLPADTEFLTVGPAVAPFVTYQYAGRQGAQVFFAKRPTSRVMRRFIRFYVEKYAKHPAIEAEFAKPKPKEGRERPHGKSGRRRAQARLLRGA